jgi:hypothetical protein
MRVYVYTKKIQCGSMETNCFDTEICSAMHCLTVSLASITRSSCCCVCANCQRRGLSAHPLGTAPRRHTYLFSPHNTCTTNNICINICVCEIEEVLHSLSHRQPPHTTVHALCNCKTQTRLPPRRLLPFLVQITPFHFTKNDVLQK